MSSETGCEACGPHGGIIYDQGGVAQPCPDCRPALWAAWDLERRWRRRDRLRQLESRRPPIDWTESGARG